MSNTVLADTIYLADVVTMVESAPAAEALAVLDGRILAVGSREQVMAHRGGATRVVDLGARALLPGFIDPHSHFMAALMIASWANVAAPPVGPVTCIADILSVLRDHQEKFKPAAGEMVVGWGYDANDLAERRDLTAEELDPLFPNNPVMLIHVSGHGAVLNSVALKKFGISAETPTPHGGVILRKPGSQEPAGLLMESAFLPLLAQLGSHDMDEMVARTQAAQEIYAGVGITTAQEGLTNKTDLAVLQKAAAEGKLYLDLISYVAYLDLEEILKTNPLTSFGSYSNHFKLAGAKCMADGSPQGRTAFFTEPYLTQGPSGEQNWRGEPSFPPETFFAMVKDVYAKGLQLLVHANGDAAIDLVLDAHEQASDEPAKDRRTTVIHAQFARADQLDQFASYKIIPSFFSDHTYFFGDIHLENLGAQRAHFLSPLKTAKDKGLLCTNHTDFNVLPINQMWTVWTAVNRISRAGVPIGPDERLTPWDALRCITVNSAYQCGEEDRKGTLEVGKLADLVVLEANPLKVDPTTIKDIGVLETIKEGRTVYSAAAVPV